MATLDKLRKNQMKRIFKRLRTEFPNIWPELETFDHIASFKLTKEQYYQKYSHQVFSVMPLERLFEYVAILGGDRAEALRVLLFMKVVIDADKKFLDVKSAREYFGIPELIDKYMK